jgi:hypothetical protein
MWKKWCVTHKQCGHTIILQQLKNDYNGHNELQHVNNWYYTYR